MVDLQWLLVETVVWTSRYSANGWQMVLQFRLVPLVGLDVWWGKVVAPPEDQAASTYQDELQLLAT